MGQGEIRVACAGGGGIVDEEGVVFVEVEAEVASLRRRESDSVDPALSPDMQILSATFSSGSFGVRRATLRSHR